jgi:hypothetical protein
LHSFLLCRALGLHSWIEARRNEMGGQPMVDVMVDFWSLQAFISLSSEVGPCVLEYTKMRTSGHFWTYSLADKLVLRHHIHRSHFMTSCPALCVRCKQWHGGTDLR